MAPVLEFFGGQREPFVIDRSELYIGRDASCAVCIDGDAAAERHVRVTMDGAGNVFIQDLDTHAGTLRNGNFVYGVQQLAEGDKIEIGAMALVFRAAAAVQTIAPPSAVRAGADERTRMPTELPPEVRAVLAARQKSPTPVPPPPIEAAPAGVVVGTPEPEPDNFRTVQMAPADLQALGLDPSTLPPVTPKKTMMGMAPPIAPKPPTPAKAAPDLGMMKTAELQAPKLPTPTPAKALTPPPAKIATQPTMMAVAPPVVNPLAPTPPMPQPAPRPQPVPMAQPAPPVAMKTAVAAAPPAPMPATPAPYTPPAKGAFGAFSRALAFMQQLFSLASQHKALLKPLVWDVAITTPIMAAFTVGEFFVRSSGAFYAVLGVEAFLLYFVDYACNAITASLVHDYATTGAATMQTAVPRVRKALPGIVTFAAVSALFDLAATYARERNDVGARIVARLLRAVWTTATYVIMPALVVEGVSFGAAFKRSKQLMDRDPTGVGAGVVAMSITSYIVAAVCFPLAYLLLRAGAHVHPAVGALLSMLIVNLYWAVSGWMKIAYATCFYLWARECERTGTTDRALAPAPLRTALDAA